MTTPEEYGTQSYEGASSAYGPNEGTFLVERLAELASALRGGRAAPEPHPLDTSYGVEPDGPPYGPGADRATAVEQPAATVARLTRATFGWDGGPRGVDRPLDRAFVTAQRRSGGRWRRVADDLGLQFLWRAGDAGRYTAQWEVPRSARAGRHRLLVTGTRYRLASRPFRVVPSTALVAAPVRGGVELRYPQPRVNVDLTSRPRVARGGRVRWATGSARSRRAARFAVPPGATIPAGGARDRWGNRTGAALRVP